MTPRTRTTLERRRSRLLGVAVALTLINLVALVVAFEWAHDVLTDVADESDNKAAERAAEQLQGLGGDVVSLLRITSVIALPFLVLFLVLVGVRYAREVESERQAEELKSYYRWVSKSSRR